jgi:hypothetical protein
MNTERPHVSWILTLLIICLPGVAAESSASPDEGALVIGTRKSAAGKVWLQKSLSDEAYQADAAEVARQLADDKLNTLDKSALVEAIGRDPMRATKAFSTCLNFQKWPHAPTRLGALKGIEIATGTQRDLKNATLFNAGKAVANTMLAEPVKEVRSAAMDLVRNNKDGTVSGVAAGMLVSHWHNAFDQDGIIDEPQRDAALGALKDLGDKRTYDALLYYATMEVHAASATSLTPPQVAFITNAGGDVNRGGGNINLPIELPNNEIRSFDATLIVPAVSAMRHITGQEFNKNLDKWRAWIKAQPDFRK